MLPPGGSYGQQALVDAWAVKPAMVLQYAPIRQADPSLAPSSSRAVRAQASPPNRVDVYIGMEPSAPPAAIFGVRGLAVRLLDAAGLAPSYASYLGFEVTMIVSQLVLKVLGHVNGPTDFALSDAIDSPVLDQLTETWRPEASGGVLLPPLV